MVDPLLGGELFVRIRNLRVHASLEVERLRLALQEVQCAPDHQRGGSGSLECGMDGGYQVVGEPLVPHEEKGAMEIPLRIMDRDDSPLPPVDRLAANRLLQQAGVDVGASSEPQRLGMELVEGGDIHVPTHLQSVALRLADVTLLGGGEPLEEALQVRDVGDDVRNPFGDVVACLLEKRMMPERRVEILHEPIHLQCLQLGEYILTNPAFESLPASLVHPLRIEEVDTIVLGKDRLQYHLEEPFTYP